MRGHTLGERHAPRILDLGSRSVEVCIGTVTPRMCVFQGLTVFCYSSCGRQGYQGKKTVTRKICTVEYRHAGTFCLDNASMFRRATGMRCVEYGRCEASYGPVWTQGTIRVRALFFWIYDISRCRYLAYSCLFRRPDFLVLPLSRWVFYIR